MKPLLVLASAFINTFGITQPGPAGTERAARYIGILLAIVVILVAAVAVMLRFGFQHR